MRVEVEYPLHPAIADLLPTTGGSLTLNGETKVVGPDGRTVVGHVVGPTTTFLRGSRRFVRCEIELDEGSSVTKALREGTIDGVSLG